MAAITKPYNAPFMGLSRATVCYLNETLTLDRKMNKYIDNNDGTITDTSTGLDWTKATIAVDVHLHEIDAVVKKAIAELGDGWRVPTRPELESIIDLSRHSPAINTDFFPDTKNYGYWTSTPCAWDNSARWVVYFNVGFVGYRHDARWCVRLCRPAR